jgi:hypothetical protein
MEEDRKLVERTKLLYGNLLLYQEHSKKFTLDYDCITSPCRIRRNVLWRILDVLLTKYHPNYSWHFKKYFKNIPIDKTKESPPMLLECCLFIHRGYLIVTLPTLEETDSFLEELLPLLNCESSYILKEEDDHLG